MSNCANPVGFGCSIWLSASIDCINLERSRARKGGSGAAQFYAALVSANGLGA